MKHVSATATILSFYTLWVLIIAISVHDGYLVVLNRTTIATYEQNPVGRWLITANSGGIAYLLIAKAIGTTITASILLWLFWRRPGITFVMTSVVASAQGLLLWYLTNY